MNRMIKIEDHVNNGHREYAMYDNWRSLPSMVDGLKVGMRKIFHVSRNLGATEEIKVSNLSGKTSDQTAYAHGEDNLADSIVVMARDYCGSNNVPYLQREGQFGNREDNQASEARYIHVRRNPLMDKMFKSEDALIVEKQFDDGQEIEPKFFLPVLPTLLLNGSEGIGNGYSSRILPRTMKDVSHAVLSYLENDELIDVPPSFNGFTGKVSQTGKSYLIEGVIRRLSRTTFEIIEMPPLPAYQFEKYKQKHLIPLLESKQITTIDNNTRMNKWSILIKCPSEFLKQTDDQLLASLGLKAKVGEVLNCWGYDNKIKMFPSIKDLIKDWCDNRVIWMETRRLDMISRSLDELSWLNKRKEFILYWNQESQTLVKMKGTELKEHLLKAIVGTSDDDVERMLSIRIASLGVDEVDKLQAKISDLSSNVLKLESSTAKQMLIDDIKALD